MPTILDYIAPVIGHKKAPRFTEGLGRSRAGRLRNEFHDGRHNGDGRRGDGSQTQGKPLHNAILGFSKNLFHPALLRQFHQGSQIRAEHGDGDKRQNDEQPDLHFQALNVSANVGKLLAGFAPELSHILLGRGITLGRLHDVEDGASRFLADGLFQLLSVVEEKCHVPFMHRLAEGSQ